MRRGLLMLVMAFALVVWRPVGRGNAILSGQVREAQSVTVAPTTFDAVRDWDNAVSRMTRTDELRVRVEREDWLLPGRTIQQLDQYFAGVRVWGSGISRQLESDAAISVFGGLYSGLEGMNVTPIVTQTDAKTRIEAAGGTELGADRFPELVILPIDGAYKLAWTEEIATIDGVVRLFLDASTGSVLRRDSAIRTQLPQSSPIGRGKGVLGDEKKISTAAVGSGFVAFDTLRPPDISTFDLRANLTRMLQFLNGVTPLATSDYASTGSTNEWNDPAVVDAHVHSSYTYDYYYKRFGRRGLDDKNNRVWNIVHVVRRSDWLFAPASLDLFYDNAFYSPQSNVMVYGEGYPQGGSLGGHYVNYLAGGLDIVAHELTHGVVAFTANLDCCNEQGALNESFADMMGTSVEFFFQPTKADYLLGEDVFIPTAAGKLYGIRSMADPQAYGDPDHYSRRYVGAADSGGVHTNAGIPNQAFYLAIEGGTNRTSGIRVQGVGGANRVQIERVFYRAFAQLMPRNANFALTRLITLQAATDLYGPNSAPYNAVRDAWTAVGVN